MSKYMAASVLSATGLLCLLITGSLCSLTTSVGDHGSLELDENNWTKVLTGEWLILFYAPWCPACKSLEPEWKEFEKWSKSHSTISVASTDITNSPGLTGRFIVTSLPTIFHVKDAVFRYYKMGRDKDSFISFIKEQKWKQLESISSWKSPNSIQMSLVANFFKLSQKVRVLHSSLMVQYGLPTWGSYLIFAIATIIIGAILGIILVCIIDLIYPPGHHKMPVKDSSQESDDELLRDDLLDDQANTEAAAGQSSLINRHKIRKID